MGEKMNKNKVKSHMCMKISKISFTLCVNLKYSLRSRREIFSNWNMVDFCCRGSSEGFSETWKGDGAWCSHFWNYVARIEAYTLVCSLTQELFIDWHWWPEWVLTSSCPYSWAGSPYTYSGMALANWNHDMTRSLIFSELPHFISLGSGCLPKRNMEMPRGRA